MIYLGYRIDTRRVRHTVYTPDGSRVGTFSSAAAARRWVRTLKAASGGAPAVPGGTEASPDERSIRSAVGPDETGAA